MLNILNLVKMLFYVIDRDRKFIWIIIPIYVLDMCIKSIMCHKNYVEKPGRKKLNCTNKNMFFDVPDFQIMPFVGQQTVTRRESTFENYVIVIAV